MLQLEAAVVSGCLSLEGRSIARCLFLCKYVHSQGVSVYETDRGSSLSSVITISLDDSSIECVHNIFSGP